MSTTADVIIRYTDTGFARAQTNLDRVNSAIGKTGIAVKNLSLGVAGAVSAWALATNSAINFADAIDKQSKIANISATRFQSLTFAAGLYGVTQDQLTDGLKDLSKNMGDANPVFEELGVAIRDNNGAMRTTEEVLDDVSDALKDVESPAERAALAARAMGEAGQRMATLLGEGSDAIGVMEQKARDLGLVLSQETIEGATAARDELDTLAQIIKVNLTNALLTATPQITEIVQQLTSDPEGIKEFGENIAAIAVNLAEAAGAAVRFTNAISRAITKRFGDANELAAFIAQEEETLAEWKETLAGLDADDFFTTELGIEKRKNDIAELTKQIENYRVQLNILNTPDPTNNPHGELFVPPTKPTKTTSTSTSTSTSSTSNVFTESAESIEARIDKQAAIEQAAIEAEAMRKATLGYLVDYQEYQNSRTESDRDAAEERIRIAEDENQRKQDLTLNYLNKAGGAFADYVSATGEGSERQKDKVIADLKAMIIQALLFKAIAGLSGGALQVTANGSLGLTPTANARGGVFNAKTNFDSSNTLAEQCPEAIMPLRRDASGNLGVVSAGGGGGTVVNNMPTVNVTTNSDNPSEVADAVVKAIIKAEVRNTISAEQRSGGLLGR